MNIQLLGQFAALGTAFCWSITSLSFAEAGRRIGSLQVNLIRLVMAFSFFALYSLIVHGWFLPVGATRHIWIWLLLSGLAGFVLGDLFLFRAFVEIGARNSMVIYSSVPFLTAILGRIILGERLLPLQIIAMVLTVVGITTVTLTRDDSREPRSWLGFLYAFIGSIGQALGLVLSRYGAPEYDVFSATQIRTIAGIAGFVVVITISRRWRRVARSLADGKAMRYTAQGSFFGPFLGVSLGLYAAQRAGTGIAATIVATVPIILIPVSIFLYHERVSLQEIIGSFVAVAGVALLFVFT